MAKTPRLTFKIATEPEEMEQIHRLNYDTFVEEIPQHERNPEHRLVDKFHAQNTYLIGLDDGQLVGMVAMRGERPFSMDSKLPDLDRHLPAGRRVCEIRLLSIRPHRRKSMVLLGLLRLISEYGREHGYDLAVISGTTRQIRLYSGIGFVPFGPLLGPPEAQYQPMFVTLESFDRNIGKMLQTASPQQVKQLFPETFLPGPVAISRAVRQALGSPAISHRSAQFVAATRRLKEELSALVKARHCEILLGTGTLGNDAVAWQLTLLNEPGLILTNGEFGERLTDHAARAGLTFTTFAQPWGSTCEQAALERRLDQAPDVRWLWAVHCETSTGVLNDLPMLAAVCRRRGIKLCLDCASSVGTVPLDLSDVYLASSVSGKGLGSFPGLALVFYNHPLQPGARIPRYLDLSLYAAQDGIPFTHSSNLHAALRTAVKRFTEHAPYADLEGLGVWLRAQLRDMGFTLLAPETHATPAIVTLVLPPDRSAPALGEQLEAAGFHLSYRSNYLVSRNWIQICLMGECSQARLVPLLAALRPHAPAREAQTPAAAAIPA